MAARDSAHEESVPQVRPSVLASPLETLDSLPKVVEPEASLQFSSDAHNDFLLSASDRLDAQVLQPEFKPQRTLNVLYLFAGQRRKSDVRQFLESRSAEHQIGLNLQERDLLLHGSEDDLADDAVWDTVRESIKSGTWDVLVLTPPCNTYSRAVWSNRRGPNRFAPDNIPTASPGWLVPSKPSVTLRTCSSNDVVRQ